jgi:hypothetical protein
MIARQQVTDHQLRCDPLPFIGVQQAQPRDVIQFGQGQRTAALVDRTFLSHLKFRIVSLQTDVIRVFPELSSKRQLGVK